MGVSGGRLEFDDELVAGFDGDPACDDVAAGFVEAVFAVWPNLIKTFPTRPSIVNAVGADPRASNVEGDASNKDRRRRPLIVRGEIVKTGCGRQRRDAVAHLSASMGEGV